MDQTHRIALGSVGVGFAVLAAKTAAWWTTGSAALLSDALESTVNVAASVIALVALDVAARPADANHPYGHAKAEFFSTVIEGALIVAASVLIAVQAWSAWQSPRTIAAPWSGIAINLAATGLNAVWAAVLLRSGRRHHSPALSGDGRHLLADVVTSAGVATGLGLAVLTGQPAADPALAALVAIYVLWSGLRLVGQSVAGLMDAAPSAEVVADIRRLVALHAAGALEVHDLRTRHAGRLTFLEFHLVVPGAMRVDEAHDICDRIEAALKGEMDDLAITIHVEPDGKAKHQGVLVL